jgi:hypothetical protein
MIPQLPLFTGIFIFLGILLLTIYLSVAKNAVQKKKLLILYLIADVILVSVTGTLGFFEFSELPPGVFIGALVWMLIIGILHTWLFEKFFEPNIPGKILFTLAAGFFGYGLIFMLYKIFFKDPFPWIYSLPLFFFLAPTFVRIAFNHFIEIPVRVYKEWYFPPPGTLSDPSDNEMADPIIVNFKIRKQSTDNYTVFKAKAPNGLTLGRLFYFFIMDYNSRYPDNPIIINEGEISYFKWSFYMTPSIFSGNIHLDPEISISENKIKENASVICERL